jgi:uncharacterized membrane protein
MDMGPEIVIVIVTLIFVGPLFHILLSSRSHGGAKFGWFLAYLFFSWFAYIIFLIATQKHADE